MNDEDRYYFEVQRHAETRVNPVGMQLLRDWLSDLMADEPTQRCIESFAQEVERNAEDGCEPQCELPGRMNDRYPGQPEIFYMPPHGMGV